MGYDLIIILILAILIDAVLGEPPNRVHPTVWMGGLIDFLRRHAFGNKTLYGIFIFFAITSLFAGIAYILMKHVEGYWMGIILGGVILKLQFSWKGLAEYTRPIARFIENNELENARKRLPFIVGREPANLNEKQVVSATVESIGENSVDGIISPIFYYVLFACLFGTSAGVSAAVFYRAANTLDSMIGYKEIYKETGFFTAKVDDLLNYIPARITALLIIPSAFILKEDWKNAIKVFVRDRKATPSPNSGQAMSAMAGALGTQLEKPGFYRLGDALNELNTMHIYRALRVVNVTTVIFLSLALASVYGVKRWG
jgi:adenosylcobinamide-phosphate synthase